MAAGLGFKTFTTGEVLTAADTNGYLMQGVNVFASAAARTAAIASPQEGQMSYLKDTNSTEYYSGSAWVAVGVAGGGMTLISETTASALSSLSLSSIPATYKELYLVWDGIVHSTTGSAFEIRLNNDATTSAYAKTAFGVKNGSTADTTATTGESIGSGVQSAFGLDCNLTTLQHNCSGWLRLDNYASTTKYKGVKYTSMYQDNLGTTGINGFSNNAVWQNTSAVTSIDIVRIGGSATFSNATNTSIRLYGIS
jgi:hypothetical protein